MLSFVNSFPTSMQEFWDAAIDRGLFPLAIARGTKAPIGAGWTEWNQPIPHPGAGGVGIRCGRGGVTGFDCDHPDPQTSARLLEAFRHVLGQNIPVRWGRRPRFLIPFYLTDAPVKGRTFTFADGEKLQLMGGQFIAWGNHKDTGQPYEWENWEQPWPKISSGQLQQVLADVPLRAGTSIKFGPEYETASNEEIAEAAPSDQTEVAIGIEQAQRVLGQLKQELTGRHNGRGSTIFALVGVLKFAMLHGMCTREQIEQTIIDAGHSLDEGLGGRRLGEEISRHDNLPVLRGNLIMQAIINRRTMMQGFNDAQMAPTLEPLTGYELKLEDENDELPWILHQRILGGEVHFFTGHSGAGKSAVVSDMVFHYLTGRTWLDAEIESSDGHVLWYAAEDDYGTERRLRYLIKQEPNAKELAKRFHLFRKVDPFAFEATCIAQVQAMHAMNKSVKLIIMDTWAASGICYADNDTEAVLKAINISKNVAATTKAAFIWNDHLPLGNEDAWQKGNGAKSQGSGFLYRISAKGDNISIDCGKARGAPKAKSYIGKIISENYNQDKKGRMTTVNVFKRHIQTPKEQLEQTAEVRLAAILPGVTAGGTAHMRAGHIVTFESVAAEMGHHFKGEAPDYVVTQAAAREIFKEDLKLLIEATYIRTVRGQPLFGVYAPKAETVRPLTMPNTDFKQPTKEEEEVLPWLLNGK